MRFFEDCVMVTWQLERLRLLGSRTELSLGELSLVIVGCEVRKEVVGDVAGSDEPSIAACQTCLKLSSVLLTWFGKLA